MARGIFYVNVVCRSGWLLSFLIMRVDIYPSKRVWHTLFLFFRLLYGSGAAIVSMCMMAVVELRQERTIVPLQTV
jgi:hypothetical protein